MNKARPQLHFTKPIFTRSGEPVEVLTTKGRNPAFPVVGYLGELTTVSVWALDGRFTPWPDPDPRDLVQPITVYINMYSDGGHGVVHPSRSEADSYTAQDSQRNACIKVQYTADQFDD